jgi:hypothetical protein
MKGNVRRSRTNYFDAMVAIVAVAILGLGCARFIPSAPVVSEANSANSNSANSNSNSASAPSFDSGKYAALLEKRKELAKMSPPVKLDPTAMIKGKVVIAAENLENFSDTDKLDDGFADYRLAKSIDEIGTVIQVVCSKGRQTAIYVGNNDEKVRGFASDCQVRVIDNSQPAVIAQKSFSNSKPPEVIRSIAADTNDEYMMPRPLGDIVAYINSFPVDKEIPTDVLLSEKELLRIPVKTELDPNRRISGKVMIATRKLSGEISPFNYQLFSYSSNYPNYGFNYDQVTTRSSDLNTLIRIMCVKGDRIGKVENTTQFSNKCDVSIVDYKSLTVFAQKSVENKTLSQTARKSDSPLDWVVEMPEKDIGEYIASIPRS